MECQIKKAVFKIDRYINFIETKTEAESKNSPVQVTYLKSDYS